MNPVKSMSGNMWSALLRLRRSGEELHEKRDRTLDALTRRGLAHYGYATKCPGYWISEKGELVADAYAEGQEAKA